MPGQPEHRGVRPPQLRRGQRARTDRVDLPLGGTREIRFWFVRNRDGKVERVILANATQGENLWNGARVILPPDALREVRHVLRLLERRLAREEKTG